MSCMLKKISKEISRQHGTLMAFLKSCIFFLSPKWSMEHNTSQENFGIMPQESIVFHVSQNFDAPQGLPRLSQSDLCPTVACERLPVKSHVRMCPTRGWVCRLREGWICSNQIVQRFWTDQSKPSIQICWSQKFKLSYQFLFRLGNPSTKTNR